MGPMDMSGGGGYSADFGATATATGGTNITGGTVFGNYNPAASTAAAQSWVPWAVVGAVVLGAVFMMKGAK